MKFVVANIPDAGRALQISSNADWVLLSASEALGGEAISCEGELILQPFGKNLRVTGLLSASANCFCHRCGESMVLNCESDLNLTYAPAGLSNSDTEVSLAASDLSTGWYDDGCIEIKTVIMESLALSVPSRVQCSDSSACDSRTAALLATAQSEEPAGHPAFSALKNF